MNTFGNVYSRYYDLLYKDKDYKKEVDYIDFLIKKYHPDSESAKSVLELGCGTGRHAEYLIQKGYEVYGVDKSLEMLDIAIKRYHEKQSRATFIHSDIRNLQLKKKFDIVMSLFHVVSYQTTNESVLQSFLTAKNHLKENGIFIFDFWYGPGVLNDKPQVRVKRLNDDYIEVVRVAEPVMRITENIVEVYYQILIRDKKTKICTEQKEQHLMRYFFLPELEFLLGSCGLKINKAVEWLDDFKELSLNSWYGVVISSIV